MWFIISLIFVFVGIKISKGPTLRVLLSKLDTVKMEVDDLSFISPLPISKLEVELLAESDNEDYDYKYWPDEDQGISTSYQFEYKGSNSMDGNHNY